MNSILKVIRRGSSALGTAKRRIALLDPEVEYLAQLVWRAEGCLAHRRAACRREVEMQLRATRSLLVRELSSAMVS